MDRELTPFEREAAIEEARKQEAILTIGTLHMDENALAAFRYGITNYGHGYLYQDVPRHSSPFYTRAKYSKRGNKRK